MTWFEFDSFRFEEGSRILTQDGRPVALAPKAADLLFVFLEEPDNLFTKDQLKRKVWPGLEFVEDNTLFFQVSCLREALGEKATGRKYIENLTRRGYRFVAPVQKHCTTNGKVQATGISPDVAPEQTSVPGFSLARWLGKHRWVAISVAGIAVAVSLAVVITRAIAPPPHILVSRYTRLTHDGFPKLDRTLFSDGVRVYFQQIVPRGYVIGNVSATGGDTGEIALPKGFDDVYDLSPRTSEVLVSPDIEGAERPLWAVSLISGAARRVGNLFVMDAKWSPDGKQIAVAVHQELQVANADGSQKRKIVAMSGLVSAPEWSPNQRTIRFTEISLDNTWRTIWEVNADGTNLHRVLPGWNDPPQECCGVWTGDGDFFIFQSDRGGRRDLWAIPEKSGFLRGGSQPPIRLTSGNEAFSSPTPAEKGGQIFAIGREMHGELVRYDSKLKVLVPFLGGISATWISFSRSGRFVAYISYPDSTIWRANRDGSEKTQLTFAPFEANGLEWSPDDQWLAFRGKTGDSPWKIYLMPSSGGKPEALIPGETEQAIPTWSPDGTRIAFGDVPRVHGKSTGKETIHILDLRNRAITDLPGSRGLWTARWSPDGKYLSATEIEGGRLRLYDFKTQSWRSTQATKISNPTWSADSKYLYYDQEQNLRSLNRVSAIDGHVDELVNLAGYQILSWWWSGVAPDNSPLILRNLGSSEVYSLTLESR